MRLTPKTGPDTISTERVPGAVITTARSSLRVLFPGLPDFHYIFPAHACLHFLIFHVWLRGLLAFCCLLTRHARKFFEGVLQRHPPPSNTTDLEAWTILVEVNGSRMRKDKSTCKNIKSIQTYMHVGSKDR